MNVDIQIDGNTETIDLDVGTLTLREAVILQQTIGDDKWDTLAEGTIRPDIMQAIIYAKLKSRYPNMTIDDFDFDFTSIETSDPTRGAD